MAVRADLERSLKTILLIVYLILDEVVVVQVVIVVGMHWLLKQYFVNIIIKYTPRVSHGSRLVCHGSRLVFHGFSPESTRPKLYPGPKIQSRSAAQRAA